MKRLLRLGKRGMAFALGVILTFSLMTVSASAAPLYTEEAQTLYELGLFKGTGTNADGTPVFALDRQATRIEGLVMLIRLLGEEDDALAYTGECPFTDVPSWAEKYAGYAYEEGYTKGTSATTFSDGPLYSNAFLTFVLRSLGYNDTAGDFTYNTAYEKAAEVGIITAGKYADQSKAIYRDDCAIIAYNALKSNMKDTNTKLMDKLVADGVLSDAMIQSSGILYGKVSIPVAVTGGNGKYIFDMLGKDFLEVIPDAAYIDNSGWGGTTAEMFEKMVITPIGVVMGSGDYTDYLEGRKPSRPALTPTRTMSFERGYGLVILSVFDNDFNLLAYCALAPGRSYDGVTELVFTTCNYNGKEDMKRIESVISNVKELSSDAVYVEKIITVQEDGTESVEQYLRINEDKWPSGIGTAAYYSVDGGRDKDTMLRAYASFGKGFKAFGVDQEYGTQYDGNAYLHIFNEARDIVACLRLPKELTIVETVIEE